METKQHTTFDHFLIAEVPVTIRRANRPHVDWEASVRTTKGRDAVNKLCEENDASTLVISDEFIVRGITVGEAVKRLAMKFADPRYHGMQFVSPSHQFISDVISDIQKNKNGLSLRMEIRDLVRLWKWVDDEIISVWKKPYLIYDPAYSFWWFFNSFVQRMWFATSVSEYANIGDSIVANLRVSEIQKQKECFRHILLPS